MAIANRFALPVQPKEIPLDLKEKTSKCVNHFVAMPNETMWLQGFKPGWMLSDTKNPPENYSDAQKMHKIYLKTGKVVYPRRSKKDDFIKGTVSAYMNKNTHTKKNKKNI